MSIRWYTVVVDCRDVAAQSRWWARVLDWRIGYEAVDRRVNVGQDPDKVSWVVMADPEGNELCVLSARE